MTKLFKIVRTASNTYPSVILEGTFTKEDATTKCLNDIKLFERGYDNDLTFIYQKPIVDDLIGAYLSTKRPSENNEMREFSMEDNPGSFMRRGAPPHIELFLLYFIEEVKKKPYSLYLQGRLEERFDTVEDAINRITEMAKEGKQHSLTISTKAEMEKAYDGIESKPILTFTVKTAVFLEDSRITYYQIYKED